MRTSTLTFHDRRRWPRAGKSLTGDDRTGRLRLSRDLRALDGVTLGHISISTARDSSRERVPEPRRALPCRMAARLSRLGGHAAEVTRTPRSDPGIAVSGRPEACPLTEVGPGTRTVDPEHWGGSRAAPEDRGGYS